jgi:hypothetical protein
VPITTNVVSSNPAHGEVYSIQHYVINFVIDLRQVGDFLRVLRFSPPIKHCMFGPMKLLIMACQINLLKFLVVIGLQMDQRQLTITIRRFFEASYVNYAYICSIAIAIIKIPHCRISN